MTPRILVTGGTGVLGEHVVRRLAELGRDVRVLSRRGGPPAPGVEHAVADLSREPDLTAALAGVEVVLHLAGSAKGDGTKTRALIRAVRGSGVRHLVLISVVGADRVPIVSARDRMAFGYYGEKRAAEVAVEGSGIPWTTLRATQFHDLLLTAFAGIARSPIGFAFSGVRFQPIEADEVAARLVELVEGSPAGLADEMGGPEIAPMRDLLRTYLAAVGKRRPILSLGSGGAAATAMQAGANLTLDHSVGRLTWEAFLARRVG
jgi:uncharacterized protein YbjT (DUF2867 family)